MHLRRAKGSTPEPTPYSYLEIPQKFAKSSIELTSGCDLYLRAVTRTVSTCGASEVCGVRREDDHITWGLLQDFEQLRAVLLEHGRAFVNNGATMRCTGVSVISLLLQGPMLVRRLRHMEIGS